MLWLLYMHIFSLDFLRFDMSLLLFTVTLRGYLISIAYFSLFIWSLRGGDGANASLRHITTLHDNIYVFYNLERQTSPERFS